MSLTGFRIPTAVLTELLQIETIRPRASPGTEQKIFWPSLPLLIIALEVALETKANFWAPQETISTKMASRIMHGRREGQARGNLFS